MSWLCWWLPQRQTAVTEQADGGELVNVDDWEREVASEGVGVPGRTIVE